VNTCPTCPNDLVCHDLGECLARNKPEPAPDYGEPWRVMPYADGGVGTREARPIIEALRLSLRAVECVNACAGFTDPAAEIASLRQAGIANAQMHLEALDSAAEIAAMREAIREAHEAIEEARAAIAYEAGTWRAVDPCLPKSSSAITKLQPFLDQ
jgi:hypothetical protein